LAQALATTGISALGTSVGSGTLLCLDWPQPQDEQRDYERLCASGEAFSYMLL
jgi:hypothetical protein